MASSHRKIPKKLFITYLGSSIFVILVVTTNCSHSDWDIINCPNFCQCFWLYGLKWADCTDHRLYSVQTGVDGAVQALDLSNNSISSLANYELRDAGLTRLKLLNLSSNAISQIGLMAFVDLRELRVLDLSTNHLYSILPDTFVKNKKLEVLELAGNNLNRHLPKLQSSSLGSLDLSNCGISHLSPNTFDGLPRLRALDLTDNVMIQLELDILKGLPSLVVLMIERNPWSCNSNMYELQKRLRAQRIIFKRVCNENNSPDSNNVPKKFEKIIALERPSAAEATTTKTTSHDDNSGRLLTRVKNRKNSDNIEITLNPCQLDVSSSKIDTNNSLSSNLASISSYWFLAIGFLLGTSTSTILTYLWLTGKSSRSFVDVGRGENMETDTSEIANQRLNLLQHLWQNNDYDNIRSTSRCPGTPPPPYRDVMLHANLYPRPNIPV